VSARIDVVIPFASMCRDARQPGEVAGLGPVPPASVRDLLAHPAVTGPCQVRGLLVDSGSGCLVGLAGDLGRVHWVASAAPGGGYRHRDDDPPPF
jgi:hypothetical protein